MVIDLFGVNEVSHSRVGGKAYNLHKLHHAGLPVPRAAVICPHTIDVTDLASALRELNWLNDTGLFAVRSSGVGEDSQCKSWAGIFDSYLYVKSCDIALYTQKVVDSMESSRYKKYSTESGIEISSMAVVVQEMIDADYAGVSFTTSPIEKDNRIALIEVVKGVGESLVSGQKTPATIRINKATGMSRIQQIGDDGLSEGALWKISNLITPYLYEIEELYGQAMDVEWAVRNNKVYILQARPITTI